MLSSLPLEGSIPRISPHGYNASLSEIPVEFTCIAPHDAFSFIWTINGNSSGRIGGRELGDRGITVNGTYIVRGKNTVTTLHVQPKDVNDNTNLQCLIVTSSHQVTRSEEVLLQVQGKYVVFM